MYINPRALFLVIGVAAIAGGIGGLSAALVTGGIAAFLISLL